MFGCYDNSSNNTNVEKEIVLDNDFTILKDTLCNVTKTRTKHIIYNEYYCFEKNNENIDTLFKLSIKGYPDEFKDYSLKLYDLKTKVLYHLQKLENYDNAYDVARICNGDICFDGFHSIDVCNELIKPFMKAYETTKDPEIYFANNEKFFYKICRGSINK